MKAIRQHARGGPESLSFEDHARQVTIPQPNKQ